MNPKQASLSLQSAPTTVRAAELLFLDPGVTDSAQLLTWVRSDIEIYSLHPNQEPIAQIALAIADRPHLRRIHLVSHGSPGQLHFAAGIVDGKRLDAIPALTSALADSHVELLLYGCRVGSGTIGQAFVANLAERLGCTVAAASQPIGHSNHGGIWQLDVVAGANKVGPIAFESGVTAYSGHFAPGSIDVTFGTDGTDPDTIPDGQTITDAKRGAIAPPSPTFDPEQVNYIDEILQTIVLTGQSNPLNNGKIVVLSQLINPIQNGDSSIGRRSGYAITRYNANGTLDTSFGPNGTISLDSLSINDPSTGITSTYKLSQAPAISDTDTPLTREYDFILAKIEVLADGSIVTAGTIKNPALPQGTQSTSTRARTDRDFIVLKYNNSGQLDTTFGDPTSSSNATKRGFVITNFDEKGNGLAIAESDDAQLYDFNVQADGKIVLLGQSQIFTDGTRQVSNLDLAVLRYSANGTLDTTFSTDGKDALNSSGGPDTANSITNGGLRSLIPLENGSYLVVSQSANPVGDVDPAGFLSFAKYNSAGGLDAAFTPFTFSGLRSSDVGFIDVVDTNNDGVKDSIYVFGSVQSVTGSSPVTTQNIAISRLSLTTGAVDTSFGTSGQVRLDIPPLTNYTTPGAALNTSAVGGRDTYINHLFLPDGSILVMGTSTVNSASETGDFFMLRLNNNGSLAGFGSNGIVRTNITSYVPGNDPLISNPNSDDEFLGYKIVDANGIPTVPTTTNLSTLKILVYGRTGQQVNVSGGTTETYTISLARYNLSNGSLDTTFGVGLPAPPTAGVPPSGTLVNGLSYQVASPRPGIIVTDIPKLQSDPTNPGESDVTFVDVDDRGRIIIAATADRYTATLDIAGTDIVVMRLLGNGNIDTRFSPTGEIAYDVFSRTKTDGSSRISTSNINSDDTLVTVRRQPGDPNKFVLVAQTSRQDAAASTLETDEDIVLIRIGNNVPFFKNDAAVRAKANSTDAEGVGIYEITRNKKPGEDINFIDGTTNLFTTLVNDLDPEDFTNNYLEIKILALRRRPGTGTDPVPSTIQLVVRASTDPTSAIVRTITPGETGTVNFTELNRLFLTSPVGVTGSYEFDWVVSDGEDDSRRASLTYPNGQPVAQALIQIDNRPPRFTTSLVANQETTSNTTVAITGPLAANLNQGQLINSATYSSQPSLRVNVYDPDASDPVVLSAPTISTLVSTNGGTATQTTLSALPSWLSFGLVTGQTKQYEYRTIAAPTNDDVGVYTITLIATDSNERTNNDTYTGGTYAAPQAYILSLAIANINDAPTIGITPNQGLTIESDGAILALEDSPFNLSFTGTDIDLALNRYGIRVDPSETLTFAIVNKPAWLNFSAPVGSTLATLTGTATNNDVGRYDNLSISVKDNAGLEVILPFRIRVQNTNDAPTLVNPLADRPTVIWGTPIPAFQIPANTFQDIDVGDTFVYSATLASGAALPSWLTFNQTTQTFSGTPGPTDLGTIAVRVTAQDRNSANVLTGTSISDEFNITITNTPPTRIGDITDQVASTRAPFELVVPISNFTETDPADSLTYSASLVGGGALPSWLTFNTATRTFAGSPTNANVTTVPLAIRVTATDRAGAFAVDDFNLTVQNANLPPIVASPIEDQNATINTAFTFQIPGSAFQDPDFIPPTPTSLPPLTYSIDASTPLPSWLVFNPTTRTFTGTPPSTAVGTFSVRVNVADLPDPGTTFDIFDIVVDPVFPGVNFGGGNTIADLLGRDLIGTTGNDTLNGGIYNDRLRGLDGVDTLNGNSGDDLLEGGGGTDTLNGGRGNDFLRGEAGNDTLIGGAGSDVLIGGAGADILTGGTGRDKFVLYSQTEGGDTITDFEDGLDLIDLRVMFARPEFASLGFGALGFVTSGADTIIQVTNNTPTTIQLFTVSNRASSLFTAADFILV